MRRLSCLFLLSLLSLPAFAHEEAKAMPASAGDDVRGDILLLIDDAEKKLTSLAEAMPAEKYGWRPAEKIRSVGEVFMHVAGGNYFLPTFWGVKVPEGTNPREFEKNGGDKAKVLATMKASFEHARNAIKNAPTADLTKAIKLFGQDATIRQAMMVVASHDHEHLGQSIAYARMNGVAPPWSAGE
ncbi:MAG TPA: DinB family protein [Thermoanaerobaculia bacterium]|nr:DinB family protein [Thermoanaerobaculia bacterium]